MVDAVLFDLDGTLLDIDLDSFFAEYFSALGPVVGAILGGAEHAQRGLDAVMDGTRAMGATHAGQTNREVFNERFAATTGVDLTAEPHATELDRFYREAFPSLQGAMGPHEGAREVVECALGLGMRVAIATNPIFPRAAIDERMRWAGIEDLPVHVVTSYETMHSAKPHHAYFTETAELLGVDPRRALMVGDDRFLDMPAADVGMKTFYVGEGRAPGADWAGTLRDLAKLLPRLGG